jgi:Second Messenger Oligonucleotide or Dinucleotide Synthetase domain
MLSNNQQVILPGNFNPTRNGLLDIAVQQLDMPAELEKLALIYYKEISEWLCSDDSPLYKYAPKVYSQGSFRLGTVIRPISDENEFDIDLVCRLTINKELITQDKLKQMIGDRLREKYGDELKEGRRCWTLEFDGFHIDILPALPDLDTLPNGILITDTEFLRWQFSNPVDYSTWFKEQMIVRLEEQRRYVAKALGMDIKKVPEWEVRTPLQRAVQLLKRHRDIYFAQDVENQPISIIITTLAARSYNNEGDLDTAFSNITSNMGNHIEKKNGVYYVANPIHNSENFADKWETNPQRAENFFR